MRVVVDAGGRVGHVDQLQQLHHPGRVCSLVISRCIWMASRSASRWCRRVERRHRLLEHHTTRPPRTASASARRRSPTPRRPGGCASEAGVGASRPGIAIARVDFPIPTHPPGPESRLSAGSGPPRAAGSRSCHAELDTQSADRQQRIGGVLVHAAHRRFRVEGVTQVSPSRMNPSTVMDRNSAGRTTGAGGADQ